MKRYFYHCICLILSFIQLVIFGESARFAIQDTAFDKQTYGEVTGATIVGIIVLIILLLIIAMIDKLLRGVKWNEYWTDCILLVLVCPFRFIFELIAIIRLPFERAKGNYDFGERGSEGFSHLVFNFTFDSGYSTSYNKPSRSKIKTSKMKTRTKKRKLSKREKQEQQRQYYNEIVTRMHNELVDAENFLRNNRRGDGRYNVYIIPLCCIDNDKLTPFSVQNNCYNGERYIDQLFVDGRKIIYDMQFQNTLALSLRPGTYDFKVHVCGNAKATVHSNSNTKIDKTFQLNNVYVGEEDVYLGVFMVYGSVVTQHINIYTDEVVREEFNYFKKNNSFGQVSLNFLNKMCDYWMAHQMNVDEVMTQYKAQNEIHNRNY